MGCNGLNDQCGLGHTSCHITCLSLWIARYKCPVPYSRLSYAQFATVLFTAQHTVWYRLPSLAQHSWYGVWTNKSEFVYSRWRWSWRNSFAQYSIYRHSVGRVRGPWIWPRSLLL